MAELWFTGNSFTLPPCTTKKAIGDMLTPAPLPPPNGNLYWMASSLSFLLYSSMVSPLNSLPPDANPKPTFEIGIMIILLDVSIGSPMMVLTSTISLILFIAVSISPSIGCSFMFLPSLLYNI